MSDALIDTQTELVLERASKIGVWLPWYFTRGVFSLLTVPLFVGLAICVVQSTLGAILQFVALVRVTGAVFGAFGLLLVLVGAWIPLLIPPILYVSLAKNLPGLWMRPDATTRARVFSTVGVLIALPLAASLAYRGITLGIGWIADRDPCAAFAAGVTGSKPPTDCPQ